MKNPKIKRLLTLIVEPIALGLLALLFIIPSLTVINLQPITKKLQDMNVLGVSNRSGLEINIVGGTHQIFKDEDIDQLENIYTYTTKLLKREADNYSKPILEIVNNKEDSVSLEIYGGTETPTGSSIALIVNDQLYKLQDQRGDTVTQKITLAPNEKQILFLSVESFSNVQFEASFTLNIKELE